MKTYQLYINGEYVDPANNEWFESIDPYRGEPWAKIPRGSKADADKAVKAANEAMWRGPWSKMTASARGKVMRKLGDLVAANAERLAEIEVRDNGKLMAEMLGNYATIRNGGGTLPVWSTSSRAGWSRSTSRKRLLTRRTSPSASWRR